MTARATRIANYWFAILYSFKRFSGRRPATIADLNALDDRLLEDIGLRRTELRNPQCLGDYHPKVVAISSFVWEDK